MSAIIILIIANMLVAIGFLIAYFWSVESGQYDDDYTPSVRILFDDEIPESPKGDLNSAQFTLGGKKSGGLFSRYAKRKRVREGNLKSNPTSNLKL